MCKVRKQKSSVDYWEARVSVILTAVKLSFLLGTKQPSWELKATVFGDHISLGWPTWHVHVTPCCKKNNFRTLLLNCSIPNSILAMWWFIDVFCYENILSNIWLETVSDIRLAWFLIDYLLSRNYIFIWFLLLDFCCEFVLNWCN